MQMVKTLLIALSLPAMLISSAPSSAAASVEIDRIRFNPPGDDDRSNASLNREIIVLRNHGNRAARMSGWRVRDRQGNVYRFGDVRLAAGSSLTLHSGRGDDSNRDVYWGRSREVWDNDKDVALLKRANGALVFTCSYAGGGESTNCDGDGEVRVVAPASIQDAIDANSQGTTFRLSGHFSVSTPIVPKSGDVFVGPAIIEGIGGNDTGFDLMPAAENVTINDLEIFGFDLRAIECWDFTIVRHSYIHHNLRNGVGCGNAIGVSIQNNEIAYNGSAPHLGDGAGGVKLAVTGDRGRGPGSIMRGNYAHHNVGIGLWCDVDCRGDLIEDNVTEFNSHDGIQYEISSGPVIIRDNTVRFNNTDSRGAHGGILLNSSCPAAADGNCVVIGNRLEGNNLSGIHVRDDSRAFGVPFEIRVSTNDLNGNGIIGCELAGVMCRDND
jgi:Lamin Tail Domain/Right handed beta helix region